MRGLPGRPAVFALIAIVLALAAPAVARAERRIAVLEIEGARTDRLQQAITAMVKEKHENLRATTYWDAAKRLRATRMTPKDVKRVCGYLEIDGVLEGTIVPEAGRYRLTLRLRSGKTGAIDWKQGVWLNEPRLSDRIARGLKQRLNEAVGELPSMAGTARRTQEEAESDEGFVDERQTEEGFDDEVAAEKPEPKARPEPKKPEPKKPEPKARPEPKKPEPKKPEPKKPEPKARPEPKKPAPPKTRDDDEEIDDEADEASDADKPTRTAARDDDEDDDEGDDDEGDDDEGDDDEDGGDSDDPDASISLDDDRGAAAPAGPAGAPMSLSAGMSFTSRRLGFVVAPDLENAPPGYKGALVPGVYVAGDAYPMAFGGKGGLAARLGVGVMIDRVVKLESVVEDGAGGTVALGTVQQKYSLDVRYRQSFGSLTAIASLGYSGLRFTIDKGAAPEGVVVDVPNVNYKSVDPGLAVRYQLGAKLAVLAASKLMLVRKTGQISNAQNYGLGTALGLDADVGVEYAVTDKILVRAAGHYQRIGFTFQGKGDLTDRDQDGTIDVGGAADLYVGGWLTAGYLF